MFERKLIRHPYGHEEVLIVDGAVLRQHDLPLEKPKRSVLFEMMNDLALKIWDRETAWLEKIRKNVIRRHGKPVPTV